MSVDDPDITYGPDGRPEWTPVKDKPLPLWLKVMAIATIILVTVFGYLLWLNQGSAGLAALPAGECFNHPSSNDRLGFETIVLVSCADAHDAEVIRTWTAAGDLNEPYPSLAEVPSLIQEQCQWAYEAYVGQPLSSEHEIGVYMPYEDQWYAGYRDMMCFAESADGSPLIGSIAEG